MFESTPVTLDFGRLTDGPLLANIAATLALVAVLASVRLLMWWLLGRMESMKRRARRLWLVRVRNATLLLFLLGLTMIWFDEMLHVATALALVAAAFAIATKELWLNLTGYLFRSGAHFFTVGDRIEVGELHGDVIDHGPMGATVLEVGSKSHQHTGRAIFIPNGKFLSSPVINATFFHGYMFHTITVPMSCTADWEAAERALLQAAQEVCQPYLDRVTARMEELTSKSSLDTPATEPTVHIHLPEPDRVNLVLRVPIEARREGRTEQKIVRRYLELLKTASTPASDLSPPDEPRAPAA